MELLCVLSFRGALDRGEFLSFFAVVTCTHVLCHLGYFARIVGFLGLGLCNNGLVGIFNILLCFVVILFYIGLREKVWGLLTESVEVVPCQLLMILILLLAFCVLLPHISGSS